MQDEIEVLIVQAQSCLTQLTKLQTNRLKTMFSASDSLSQQKQFDLETNFKRLISQCKLKLDDIDKSEMSEVSHRVTSHMSESVLLQIQDLTTKF